MYLLWRYSGTRILQIKYFTERRRNGVSEFAIGPGILRSRLSRDICRPKMIFYILQLKHTVLQVTTFPVLIIHLKGRICTFTFTLPRNWTFISVASCRWSVFVVVLRTKVPDFKLLPKLVFHNCPLS